MREGGREGEGGREREREEKERSAVVENTDILVSFRLGLSMSVRVHVCEQSLSLSRCNRFHECA